MKVISYEESKRLDDYIAHDFSGVTKNNVSDLISILDKLDPEVAKALISTMPATIKEMTEVEGFYFELLKNSVDSCTATAQSCLDSEDKVIEHLAREMNKDIPFEEKRYFAEKMEDAAKRKEDKDTEHRASINKVICICGSAVSCLLTLLASFYLRRKK